MSKVIKALVRKEYPTEVVVIQGPRLEPLELRMCEMSTSQLIAATREFFVVGAAMMAKDNGDAVVSADEITPAYTTGLMFDVTIDALKRIAIESADIETGPLELADNESFEAALFAGVKVNRPFFGIWCKRFGFNLDELLAKGLAGLALK